MKITMDYMVGNTAIQIVNTGRKIKIVDVEKRAVKKIFWKRFFVVSFLAAALMVACFYVVRLENQKVLLNQQVYELQAQVKDMEKENLMMEKLCSRAAMKNWWKIQEAFTMKCGMPRRSIISD